MAVNIKTYPAKNGDCFLISFGRKNEKSKHLLIDCGFVDTVNNYLKNDLIEIADKGESIEKLIITHIDADHIQGAIRLLKENNSEKFIEIKEVWHNTFRHLFEHQENKIDVKQKQILQQIIQRGYIKNEDKKGIQEISAEQGTTVGALILKGNYFWNSYFKGKAVSIENKKEIEVDADTIMHLLSPDKQKLVRLQNFWKDELRKYGVNYVDGNSELYDDAFEMLVSWEKEKLIKKPKQISTTKQTIEELIKQPFDEDNTATNGSSIAFILKIQNKKLLFLGDSHPDLIVKSLDEYCKEEKIIFDLIKISHHGSFNNINKQLLEKIDSENYLFSTNGQRHNHPDKETIAHIISREAVLHRNLYFNYITSSSEYFKTDVWMKKYNYSIHYLNKAPYTLEL